MEIKCFLRSRGIKNPGVKLQASHRDDLCTQVKTKSRAASEKKKNEQNRNGHAKQPQEHPAYFAFLEFSVYRKSHDISFLFEGNISCCHTTASWVLHPTIP